MRKKNNPVSKYLHRFNKPKVYKDRTKVIPRKNKYNTSEEGSK